MAKRTNYKHEKRTKELDKQKKKEAKKERKLSKERTDSDDDQFVENPLGVEEGGVEQLDGEQPGAVEQP